MRATIALTGRITPDDLTPVMRPEFIALYQRWRDDGDLAQTPVSRRTGRAAGERARGRPEW
jgi:hypothetical protein